MNAALFHSILSAIAPDTDPFPHPALPPEASWPGVVAIVIVLGFFATAAVLGPVVQAIMREELPPGESSRDEKRK